jgi:Polyketide cyclase / dehydrase and lipid transport
MREMSQIFGVLVRESAAMATWTAQTHVAGLPHEVLAMLTEPDAIARWAPIAFEVVDFDERRLRAGDHVRVRGTLAGRTLEFDVDVTEAEDGRLVLTATGPIRFDVEYLAVAHDGGTNMRASVVVSGRGLMGRLMAQAADAVLAAGALSVAVERIARELEPALAL